MAMTIPTLPVMPAGYVAQVADLNNIVAAAKFVANTPLTMVHDASGGQTIFMVGTAINYTVADFDSDGMWTSGIPARLTVQTPGYYKVRYGVQDNGIVIACYAQITSGPNNPAGSGVNTPCWASYSDAQTTSATGASGVLPLYMYALDFVEVIGNPASNATQNLTDAGSFLSLELVSI